MVTLGGLAGFLLIAQAGPPGQATKVAHEVRASGRTRAVQEFTVLTPQITGQNARLTLIRLVPTGTAVAQGDTLAEFDRTQQVDNAREARARFDDFGHQVDQRKAENRSNAEKRLEEMQQAKAALAKATIQLRKGPILGEIERLKNQERHADAKQQVASLEKSHKARETADAATLRIIELKQERQKVALDRTARNSERLMVRAPLAGMVALENTYRSGSMGPAQEGDPMYPGQPLLRIFDPKEMDVVTLVDEPDGAALTAGVRAEIRLDAYPELVFEGRLQSASPVAASAMGSPIKRFAARFRVLNKDARMLPDMAAAVTIRLEQPVARPGGAP